MKALILFCAITVFYQPPTQTTYASFYSDSLIGHTMAFGSPYDPDKLTCASWDFPGGSTLRVQSASGRGAVEVVVSDRGPARRIYQRGVTIDLSKAAFRRLAPLSDGLTEVTIERIK